MSDENPSVILYDAAGTQLAVADGVATPVGTHALLVAGKDSGGIARVLLSDSNRRQVVVGAGIAGTPDGGVSSVQGTAGGTPLPVSVTGLPLPAGAATEATLGTRATEATLASVLSKLDVDLSTRASETTLGTRATEATLASILSEFDVALSTRASQATAAAILAALGPLALDATVAAILAKLDVALSTRASQVTVASILGQLDTTLSSRASQTTVASILTQLDVALSTRAAEHVTAVSPHAARLSDGAVFYKATTPADTQPTSNAVGSQVDGHSVTIGATTDLDTANTVVGRLKKIVGLLAGGLPATLTGAGNLKASISEFVASIPAGAALIGKVKLRNPGDTADLGDLANPIRTDPTGVTTQPVADANIDVLLSTRATEATLATRATEATLATRAADRTTAAAPASTRLSDGAAFYKATTPADTQPISAAALPLPAGAATEATLATRAASTQFPAALVGGRLDENVGAWLGSTAPTVGSKTSANSVPVVIASDQAALPLPTGASTSANQTNGSQKAQTVDGAGNVQPAGDTAARAIFGKLTDGTNTAAVKAASTAPVAADPATVVAISPNTPLPTALAASGGLKVSDVGTRATVGKYGAATARIAGTAGAQNIATIENPAASGKTVYVRRVLISCVSGASAQTPYQYQLARTTAVPTGGTTLTAQKRATADAAAAAIARSGAITATAAAGAYWAGTGTMSAATVVTQPTQIVAWDSRRDDDDIVLAAGEGLLVSAEANDTDLNHVVSFFWEEV